MAIWMILGTLGEGKTYYMLHEGFARIPQGVDVWSNFKIDETRLFIRLFRKYGVGKRTWDSVEQAAAELKWGRWRQFSEYSELLKIRAAGRPALVLFDEAHLWLPAQLRGVVPYALIAYWSQSRKYGVDAMMATQRFKSVMPAIAELAGYWVKAKRLHVPGQVGVWFKYTYFDTGTWLLSKRDLITRREFLALDLELARCYDTTEVLIPPFLREGSRPAAAAGDGQEPRRPRRKEQRRQLKVDGEWESQETFLPDSRSGWDAEYVGDPLPGEDVPG